MPLRGVSTPGHGQGEGPVGYELWAAARYAADHDEVDNGRGRSGAQRRGVLEMAMADAAESGKITRTSRVMTDTDALHALGMTGQRKS